ncbi:hypothetical protein [Shahe heteroptera virus 1]|uniref:hypothetical protein n=1 Tax=Shahe heteroptera virus 1 TaxID=1923417 RepID=UPI00090A4A56|nr:hypothetical protein [Shahe heteroptera virus 1]APG77401.1 hypothetical protein [Shahe heteroptera virus 1]
MPNARHFSPAPPTMTTTFAATAAVNASPDENCQSRQPIRLPREVPTLCEWNIFALSRKMTNWKRRQTAFHRQLLRREEKEKAWEDRQAKWQKQRVRKAAKQARQDRNRAARQKELWEAYMLQINGFIRSKPQKEPKKAPLWDPILGQDKKQTRTRWNGICPKTSLSQRGSLPERLSVNEPQQFRSPILLLKLRAVVRQLRYPATPATYFHSYVAKKVVETVELPPLNVIGEMDKPEDRNCTEGAKVSVQSGDTYVEAHAIPSTANTAAPGWSISTVGGDTYPELTDRYIQFDQFEWNSNSTGKEYSLPYDIIVEQRNNPSIVPILLHRLMRSDLTIKAAVSGNKFMAGQIMIAWMYGADYQTQYSIRDNAQTLSQLPHVLISAGQSNDGELRIPYRFVREWLTIYDRQDGRGSLKMGKLIVKVLNPLASVPGSNAIAHISMYAKFDSLILEGKTMYGLDQIVQGEMMPAVISAATNILRQYMRDSNRDKPPSPANPAVITPHAFQSMCAGTNVVDHSVQLRLDPLGQTPYPDGYTDEMSVQYISRIFGLVKTIKWTTSDPAGKLLGVFPVSPIWPTEHYAYQIINGQKCFSMPPVAVLSNFYSYWRGGFQLRIDIISSPFHQGKGLLVFIPYYDPVSFKNLTLSQAQSFSHMSFDLAASCQVTMDVPFISDRPWWSTMADNGTQPFERPPGHVLLLVQNRIPEADAIPNFVRLNIYWRGGPNFETAVPCQPAYGLATNIPSNMPDTDYAYAQPGSFPWYIGTWRYVMGGKAAVARIGVTSDAVAKMKGLRRNYVYEFYDKNQEKVLKVDGMTPPYTFVPVSVDAEGFVYLGLLKDVKDAAKYWYYLDTKDKKWKERVRPNYDLLFQPEVTSDNTYYDKNANAALVGKYISMPTQNDVPYTLRSKSREDLLSNALGEVGEEVRTENVVSLLPQDKGDAMHYFGERQTDLKTLCRRPEHYLSMNFTFTLDQPFGAAHYCIPIHPDGLVPDIHSNNVYRVARESLMQIIASGYAFYRGSMNLTFIVQSNQPIVAWWQHRPDQLATRMTAVSYADEHMASTIARGYATQFQSTGTNITQTLVVPWYQPGNLALLQRPALDKQNINRHITLGNIVGGFSFVKQIAAPVKIELTVYASLGDDARFMEFIGFPPVYPIVVSAAALHVPMRDMRLSPTEADQAYGEIGDKVQASWFAFNVNPTINLQPSALFTPFKDGYDKLMNHAIDQWQAASFSRCYTAVEAMLFQYLINDSRGVATSIAHLLWVMFSDFFVSGSLALISVIQKVIEYMLGSFKPIQTDQAQGEAPEVSLASKLITSLLQLIGAGVSFSNSKQQSWILRLSESVVYASKGTSQLIKFLENLFEVVKDVIHWVRMKLDSTYRARHFLQGAEEMLDHWYSTAMCCLDSNNESYYDTDPDFVYKLEFTIFMGRRFTEALFQTNCFKLQDTVRFKEILNRLEKLMEKIRSKGQFSITREEPFCLYLVGEPGIGKTYASLHIVAKVIDSLGIEYKGNPIFVKNSASDYWTNCYDQICVIFDDFAQFKDSGHNQSDAECLFNLMSTATFVPPQAAVEEKGRRFSPQLVVCVSNCPFPQASNIQTSQALYRRRDSMWRVEIAKEYRGTNYMTMTKEEKKRLEGSLNHLVFRRYPDPTNEAATPEAPISYDEFLARVIEEAKVKQARERRSRIQREKLFTRGSALKLKASNSLVNSMKEYFAKAPRGTYRAIIRTWPEFREYQRFFEKDINEDAEGEMDVYESEVSENEKVTTRHEEQPTQVDGDVEVPLLSLIELGLNNEITPKPEGTAYAAYIANQNASPPKIEKAPVPAPRKVIIKADAFAQTELAAEAKVEGRDYLEAETQTEKPLEFPEHRLGTCPCGNCWQYTIIGGEEVLTANAGPYPTEQVVAILKTTKKKVNMECKHWNQHIAVPAQYRKGDMLYSRLAITPIGENPGFVPHRNCGPNCQIWGPNSNKVTRNEFIRYHVNKSHFHVAVVYQDWFGQIFETGEEARLTISGYDTKQNSNWLKHAKTLVWFLNGVICPVGLLAGFLWFCRKAVDGCAENDKAYREVRAAELRVHQHRLAREEAIQQAQAPYDPANVAKGQRTARGLIRRSPFVRHNQSTQGQIGGMHPLEPKLIANTFYMCISGYDSNTAEFYSVQARCVGVTGRWVMMPKHYLHKYKTLNPDTRKCSVYIRQAAEVAQYLDKCPMVSSDDVEIVFIELDGKVPPFRKLYTNFKTERQAEEPIPRDLQLIEIDIDGKVRYHDVAAQRHDRQLNIMTDNVVVTTIKRSIRYPKHGPGMCMTAVVDANSILGFHVAGVKDHGYAEIIDQRMVTEWHDECIEQDLEADDSELHELIDYDGVPVIHLNGELAPAGIVQSQFAHNESGKTSFRKSAVHGVFPVEYEPNPLSVSDPRIFPHSPMQLGCQKHGFATSSFDPSEVEIAARDYTERLINVCPPVRTPLGITMTEAVCGIPGMKGFQALNLKTSEGFPYTGMRPPGGRNKEWLIKIERELDEVPNVIMNKVLYFDIKRGIEARRQGKILAPVFTDCLKDDRLKIEKCRIPGKTRIFSSSPIDFTITWRMLFGDWLMAFVKGYLRAGHAMCIAPEKADWTELMDYLEEGGKTKFLCGDYSNFGPAFDADCHRRIADGVCAWYEEYHQDSLSNGGKGEKLAQFQLDQRARRAMVEELVHAHHLCFNVLYIAFCGMPSGSPATTPTNCWVNNLYIRLAWREIMRPFPKLMTFDAFYKNTRLVVYGDDLILTVSDEVAEYFNNVTLQKFFQEHGVTYTDATKTGEVQPWRNKWEAQFLKRQWLPHPTRSGLYMSALDKSAVQDTANWIWKCPDPIEMSKETSYACLMNAFGWGPDYFNWIRETLVRAWRRIPSEEPPRFRTWEELDLIFFEEQDSQGYMPADNRWFGTHFDAE